MKRNIKRIIALILILAMTVGDSTVSFAVEDNTGTLETTQAVQEDEGEETEGESDAPTDDSISQSEDESDSGSGESDKSASEDGSDSGNTGDDSGTDVDEDSDVKEGDDGSGSGETAADGESDGDEGETDDVSVTEMSDDSEDTASESDDAEESEMLEEEEEAQDEISESTISDELTMTGSSWLSDDSLLTSRKTAIEGGTFRSQIEDDEIALDLYDALEQFYAVEQASGDAEVSFTSALSFKAELDEEGALVSDSTYEMICEDLSDSLSKAFHAFWQDYPEVFWIESVNMQYEVTVTDGIGTIEGVTLVPVEYEGAYAQLETYWSNVESVSAELYEEGISSFRLIQRIHDYLCENLSYASSISDGYLHTSAAVFLGEETVSGESYAKAFKVLCDEMDIPCVLISGTAGNEGLLNAHMWNYVRLENGGEWYLVDAALDDQEEISYDYFLAGGSALNTNGEKLSATHVPTSVVTGVEDFYFVYPTLTAVDEKSYPVRVYVIEEDEDGDQKSTPLGYYTTLDEAKYAIVEESRTGADSFHLELRNDVELSGDALSFPSTVSYANLDLNGHTLLVTADSVVQADLYDDSTDESGRVKAEEGVTLSLGATVSVSVANLSVAGTLTAEAGSVLNVTGTASLSNISVVEGEEDECFHINLCETLDEEGNTLSLGSLSISGTLTKADSLDYAISMGKWQIAADATRTEVTFDAEEVLTEVTLTDTKIPAEYFMLSSNPGQKLCVIRSGNQLIARGVAVRVSYNGVSRDYTTFDLAISGISSDFGSKSGSYTFTFASNAAMTKSVTLPTCVTQLTLTTDSEEEESGNLTYSYAEFDFKGFTLSSSKAIVTLGEGLSLVSSGSKNGTLSLTVTPSSGNYSFKVATLEEGETLSSDYVDCDSTLLIDGVNITASNGSILLADEGTSAYTLDSVITTKQLCVNSGDWTVSTVSGSIENSGTLHVETAKTISTLDNKSGAIFVCGSFVQSSSGKTYLEAGSTFVVEQSATIYNTVLGGQNGETAGDVHFYQYEGASISFLTKVSQTNTEVYLSCGIVALDEEGNPIMDEESGSYTVAAAEARSTLFNTKISSFPVSYCKVEQPEDNAGYTVVYQNGQKICVGGEWISIYAQNTNGSETLLSSFTRWTDAQSYLNTLSNTSTTYIVELSEDVIVEESLTMPTKVGGLIFRGKSEDDRVVFSFVGNLTLTVNTTFENIELQPTKYNSSTASYVQYASVITLSGKNLTLTNVKAEKGYIDYIKGTTASTLTVTDSELYTTRYLTTIGTVNVTDSELTVGTSLSWNGSAIASVTYLNLTGSAVTAQGSVAVTNTLTMENSTLDTNGKMSLVNIVSNDANNTIGYGGNISTKILTITGTVTSDKLSGQVDVTVTEGAAMTAETGECPSVRKAAISLIVHSLADEGGDGYSDGATLLNATKASASWFVIGKTITEADDTETVSVQYTTYKDGTVIRCGDTTTGAAVVLYSLDTEGTYLTDGGFATLQEAFSEIDRLADISAEYKITIQSDTAETVTKTSTNLTFPTKTKAVIITSGDETNKTIYFNSSVTLKSNVTLENITLSPKSSATIALSAWSLTLNNCSVADEKKITAISGSSVSGASCLNISGSDLTVAGTVSGVGTVSLNGATLTAQSTINIGNLCALTGEEALIGYATVTRKNSVVTAVSTSMTINGEVYAESGVTLGLQEKVSGEYIPLELLADEMANLGSSGINIAKAPQVSTTQISVRTGVDGKTSDALIKSSGYLTYTTTAPGVLLSYTDADGRAMQTRCLTVAQASTEINNLKTKRDYTMELQEAITSISLSSPTALSMPSASYVSSLLIDGTQMEESVESMVTVYFTGSITLSANTTLKNLDLVQMVKSGSVYYKTSEKYSDMPPVMTLAVGAYTLEVEGDVVFHTPISMTGSSKGTLNITSESRLFTETNGNSLSEAGNEESLICGSVKSFAQISVKTGQTLILKEYTTNGKTYTAPGLSATTLNNRGVIELHSHLAKNYAASASFTTAVFLNGTLDVEGSVSFTNLTLSGETEITVDKTFNITGTLTSTTSEAYLYTRRQGANKAPYLNVSGTVALQDSSTDRIHVGVYPVVTDTDSEFPVTLTGSPSVTGQLLTAKSGTADMFLPWEENVGMCDEYSASEPNGYILKKSGTAIYVYQSEEIVVALCEGDLSGQSLEDAETAGAVLDYYPSFSDAVTAVNTLKNSSTTYTLMLLQDVGSTSSPVSITMPTYAKKIFITSQEDSEGKAKGIYYTNTITLKCATVFDDVIFAPMKSKNTGTSLGFSTGVYDLTLKDVEVSSALSGMALSSIAGNAKQTTTLDSSGLSLTGNVQSSLSLTICQDTEIKGVVSATNLCLEGGVTLTTGSTVTITNVQNNGDEMNTIVYGKTAKNVTYLTISGDVGGTNENPLALNLCSDATAEDLILTMDSSGLKTSLTEAKKLANITKAPTSAFTILLDGESLDNLATAYVEENTDEDSTTESVTKNYYLVKAGKAIYLTDDEMPTALTLVYEDESEDEVWTLCLDWAQTVNEITALADVTMDYIVYLDDDVLDTNITDSSLYSTLSMPASNKAGSVTVCPENNDADADEETTGSSSSEETQERTTIQFYGNITAYGNLTLKDIELKPTRSASVATTAIDFKISVAKSNAGASLTLDNVSTWTDENWENGDTETTGFISQITGTSNATSVTLIDCDLRLKTGISSIGNLALQDTTLMTCGTSSIYDLILQGNSSWDALGKTSIVNVDSSAMTGGYLGSKQVAKTLLSQLTITGTVSNPMLFRMATAACTTNDVRYLDETTGETYKNVMLAIALKADADNFIAYPYGSWTDTDGETTLTLVDSEELKKDNWISYKDSSGYVYNGDIDDMAVSITKGTSVTYATSFYEAVTIINNAADTTADYTICFLQTEDEDYVYVGTAKDGAYGALTLPTKAASVTICGATATDPCTVLCYTGTMTPRCKVTFENILLTEGTYNSKTGVFTPSYAVTPVFGSYNYELTFAATAATLTNDAETNDSVKDADLVFSYVSASKGALTVENRDIYVKSYAVVTNLRLEDAELGADSYITVTNLTLEGSSALTTCKAMKLTTLSGEGDDAVVRLNTGFTTITKSTQRATTQLTISGNISGVSVEIAPYMYDLSTKTYHTMTVDEAAALNISEGKTLTSYDKIAVLTKAAAADITVLMDDEEGGFTQAAYEADDGEMTAYTLYKYEGGLYMTNQQMQVRLIGYTDSDRTEDFYQADFLSWDQAVKEIDRIADTTVYYDMLLMTDAGGPATASTPLGTVSMPTKAAAVRIAPYAEETEETADEDGDEHSTEETTDSRYLFFTGTTFTIRCDTTFDNVGLIAVKKTTVSGVTSYSSTTFNITGNNWDLVLKAMPSGAVTETGTEYECLIGTLNGGSKGSFTLYEGISETTLAAVATKLTNYGTVEFYNENCNTENLVISGSLSGVTNLILHENVNLSVPSGALTATNLTLTESSLSAKNITSTGTATLESARISAGTTTVGDGIVKLGTIVCQDYNNEIYAKQSSSGSSQLTITGYVSCEGAETESETDAAITVGLYYNNSASRYAQLYDGMTLLTASKASASWFEPCYTVYTTTTETDEDGEETTTTTETAGMGSKTDGYGLVKSGSAIKYTDSSDMEVRLYYLENVDDETTVLSSTLFATFEEAVTEINNLSRYRTGTKVYDDYEIELLKDVEIGNTSGNGAYSSLTLPTKAGNVRIYSEGSETYTIYYAGTLTLRCNTELDHVGLSPMKAVNKVGVATSAAWALGAYTLTLDQVCTSDADGNTQVSSVSSSTGSALALLGNSQLTVSGNFSVYKICFVQDTEEAAAVSEGTEIIYDEPVLRVDGTLTATLIYLDGDVSPVIQKPESSSFTLNGASLDVDGDGVKESVSVVKESDDSGLTVHILSDEVAAGTKVLTDKYLDLTDYTVIDDSDFTYPIYQSGNNLMVGNLLADKTLEGFVRLSDGAEVTYKLSSSKIDYTGSEIKPGLILQCEEETLVEDTDYTLTYSDNILPGTATITVAAAEDGAYEGTAEITFTIRKKSLASKNIEITFDGSLTKMTVDGTETWAPGVYVVDKDRTDDSGYLELKENSDYALSYRLESDGTVSAVISEYTDGYYRGKVVKNFKKVTASTTYTLTNCIASDTNGDTSAGAVIRLADEDEGETVDTELLIQLSVSGSDLAGLTNLYVLEMDNQGDDVVGYVGNAEAVYSEDSKTTTLTATLAWDDESSDNFNSSMMDRYALVAVTDTGYQVISKNSLLVQNPEVTAVTTNRYYSYYTYNSDGERDIDTKKGMQGASAYAGDLGVQAEVINIKLNELIKTTTNVKKYGSSAYVAYKYKGKTYYFFNMISYQKTIYALNGWDKGAEYGITGRTNVTVDLLLGWDSELTYLIHPSARTSGHTYYALNMQEEKARETFEALFCYLGYKLGGSEYGGQSAKKYRVLNWTLGNEVNCCKAWNYSGNLSTSACASNYAEAFQLLYQAIRRTDSNARFFISLDHSWTASTEGHSGKSYLDSFAAYMYKTAPQISWNVNYHPYSQPLTRVDFWNDSSNTTSSTSTKYISMQNLSVLTNYLGTLETKYKMTSLCTDTRQSTEKGYIRVILGEQGYTARYGYSSEMSLQVTALQKLHSIAMANTRVDAYMNRAYLDDASEAASGLYLGLMNTSGQKKTSYAAFKKL